MTSIPVKPARADSEATVVAAETSAVSDETTVVAAASGAARVARPTGGTGAQPPAAAPELIADLEPKALDARGQAAQDELRALVDPGSYIRVEGRAGLAAHSGRGTAQGRAVVLYGIEGGHPGGAIGPEEAETILAAADDARRSEVPLISVNVLLEPRPGSGLDGMIAVHQIASASARLSQMIPQIAVVTDPAAGATAGLSLTADLIVLGGAHAPTAGDAAHVLTADAPAAFDQARRLARLLPSTPGALRDALAFSGDGGDRVLPPALCAQLTGAAPIDVRALIDAICDAGSFVELEGHRGRGLITGLAAIFGQTVGLTASQPGERTGLDRAALEKATELIALCERYSIPLINLIDAGVEPTEVITRLANPATPPAPLIRSSVALTRARQAVAPSVTLILRRASGLDLFTWASRPHHAVIAYPGAELSPDGPGSAAKAFERGLLQKIVPPEQTVPELVHWTRWSRAERARVTLRLRPNDPLLYNLKLPR